MGRVIIKNFHEIDDKFLKFLKLKNITAHEQLLLARKNKTDLDSNLLIDLSEALEEFLVDLFHIKSDNKLLELQAKLADAELISYVRKNYFQKKIFSQNKVVDVSVKIDSGVFSKLMQKYLKAEIIQLNVAKFFKKLLDENLELPEEEFMIISKFALNPSDFYKDWMLFHIPKKVDFDKLVQIENNDPPLHHRSDFSLTDQSYLESDEVMFNVNYCIYCHNQKKDSCRTGLHEKNTGEIQANPLGVKLEGCPLGQKISEMNLLVGKFKYIAALAVAMIDNPLIPATGHRICNDCMKSCIYQKQEPVDIPLIETSIISEVLNLDWGFEIYYLLTNWNPLKSQKFLPAITNKTALVAGLGPAGFAASYYLSQEGYQLLAVDSSVIQEIPKELLIKPMQRIEKIYDLLYPNGIRRDGFGGVMEYGITARWDKRFLGVIKSILARREGLMIKGGTRFDKTLLDFLKASNFNPDKIILACGSGKPNLLNTEGAFSKGFYNASEILMVMHLQQPFLEEVSQKISLISPIIVVGGGLTAIDVATEAKAFIGQKNTEVTIFYRGDITKSPSYRTNHIEIEKAQQEGVKIVENIKISKINIDEEGRVYSIETNQGVYPAKTIINATGTESYKYFDESIDISADNFYILGDMNIDYHGSVVKAIASAKNIVREITKNHS